ncbi:MAG: HAD family phosphatase [Clostridia bacterium]|nr:HAD family phosphatase [Clostridia bacterium]
MTPIKAIIFDKDGTLQDTEKVFMQAWKLAADEFGVPDIEKNVRTWTGLNVPTIAARWAEQYPDVPFDVFHPRQQALIRELLAQNIPVMPGAYELLTYLNQNGYLVGMATSTPRDKAMEHLERTDMVKYFHPDAIITGDMIPNGKPAPDIFLKAAERLGVDPAACVGVEDSPNGVRAIHAAGMRAVMIPDLVEPTPDVEALLWRKCEHLLDLIPWLEEGYHK